MGNEASLYPGLTPPCILVPTPPSQVAPRAISDPAANFQRSRQRAHEHQTAQLRVPDLPPAPTVTSSPLRESAPALLEPHQGLARQHADGAVGMPPSSAAVSSQSPPLPPQPQMALPPSPLPVPGIFPTYTHLPATVEEAAAYVMEQPEVRTEHVPGAAKVVLRLGLPREMLELLQGEEALSRAIKEDLMIATRVDSARISVDKVFAEQYRRPASLLHGAGKGAGTHGISVGAVVCFWGAPEWRDSGIRAADARHIIQDLSGQSLDPYSALYAGSVTRYLDAISIPSNSRDPSPIRGNARIASPGGGNAGEAGVQYQIFEPEPPPNPALGVTPRYPPHTLTHVPTVPSSILKKGIKPGAEGDGERAHSRSGGREVSEEDLARVLQVRGGDDGAVLAEGMRGGNMREVLEEYLQKASSV